MDGLNCPLYKNNAMDSISLVTLISQVESDIEDEFNIQVILADEKAMSQKNSPFLTVGTLTSYIINQLEAVKNA
jgi:acyl carrier protein